MKKLICVVLAIVLLLSFSACGLIGEKNKLPEKHEDLQAMKQNVVMVSSIDEWDTSIKTLKSEDVLGVVVTNYSIDTVITDAEFLKRFVAYLTENETVRDYPKEDGEKFEYYFYLEDKIIGLRMDEMLTTAVFGDELGLELTKAEMYSEKEYILDYIKGCEQLQAEHLKVPESKVDFFGVEKFALKATSISEWDEQIKKLQNGKLEGIVCKENYFEASPKVFVTQDDELMKKVVSLLNEWALEEGGTVLPKTGGEINEGANIYIFVDGEIVCVSFSSEYIFATSGKSIKITNFDGVEAEIETLRGELRKQPELK